MGYSPQRRGDAEKTKKERTCIASAALFKEGGRVKTLDADGAERAEKGLYLTFRVGLPWLSAG
jgi:hypothetical protein